MALKRRSPRLQGFRDERTLRSDTSKDRTIRLRKGLDGDKPKAKRQRSNPQPQRAAGNPVQEDEEDGAGVGVGTEGKEAEEVVNQQESGHVEKDGITITIKHRKQCKGEAVKVKTKLEERNPGLSVVLELEEDPLLENKRPKFIVLEENGSIIVVLDLKNIIIMGSDTRILVPDGVKKDNGREVVCRKILDGKYWLMAICGNKSFGQELHWRIEESVGDRVLDAPDLVKAIEEEMIRLGQEVKAVNLECGVIGGLFEYHTGTPVSKLFAAAYEVGADFEDYSTKLSLPQNFCCDGCCLDGLEMYLDAIFTADEDEEMTEKVGIEHVITCVNLAAGNARAQKTGRTDVNGGNVHIVVMRALSKAQRDAGIRMIFDFIDAGKVVPILPVGDDDIIHADLVEVEPIF